jgi:hypothetical protein
MLRNMPWDGWLCGLSTLVLWIVCAIVKRYAIRAQRQKTWTAFWEHVGEKWEPRVPAATEAPGIVAETDPEEHQGIRTAERHNAITGNGDESCAGKSC